MRRDTPKDERLAPVDADTTLRALKSVETLEAGYSIWGELRRSHAARRLIYAEERRRLEGEGRFLLGAIKAAGDLRTKDASLLPTPSG